MSLVTTHHKWLMIGINRYGSHQNWHQLLTALLFPLKTHWNRSEVAACFFPHPHAWHFFSFTSLVDYSWLPPTDLLLHSLIWTKQLSTRPCFCFRPEAETISDSVSVQKWTVAVHTLATSQQTRTGTRHANFRSPNWEKEQRDSGLIY